MVAMPARFRHIAVAKQRRAAVTRARKPPPTHTMKDGGHNAPDDPA
jgi:hypothetical protein